MTGFFLLIFGFFLGCAGLIQCLNNKKFLAFLIGIELILNGVSLNFAGFYSIHSHRMDFQIGILLVISFAVIETVVGLSIFTWSAKILKEQPEISLL